MIRLKIFIILLLFGLCGFVKIPNAISGKVSEYPVKAIPEGTDYAYLIDMDDTSSKKALLSSMAGTVFQAYNTNLDIYAGITPSANVQSLLSADNYAAMKVLLGLTIGTHVQGYHANLASISALSYASTAFVKMTGANTFSLDTNSYYYQESDVTQHADAVAAAMTSFPLLDGSSDALQSISLYDGDSNKGTLAIPNLSVDATYTLPGSSGTLQTAQTTFSGYGISDTLANLEAALGINDIAQLGQNETISGYWSNLVFRGTLATGALGSIATMDMFWTDPDNYDPASTGLTGAGNDYLALKTPSGYAPLFLSDGSSIHGQLQLPYTTSGDWTGAEAYINQKSDEDAIALHGGSSGEVQGEALISMLQHIAIPLDPAAAYDQESTYRSFPLFVVGDDFPHGFTLTEWRINYVGGDPTTELDADLICDTTPDYNTAAGATVMDVLNTTAGASSADTGFDSATCANGGYIYIHFGADPTDSNVLIAVDIWGYAEED